MTVSDYNYSRWRGSDALPLLVKATVAVIILPKKTKTVTSVNIVRTIMRETPQLVCNIVVSV